MKRLGQEVMSLVLSLVIVSIILFAMIRLSPSDPIRLIVNQPGSIATVEERNERIEQLKREQGLDQSIPRQYVNWVRGVSRGQLGTSIFTREAVAKGLKRTFWPSMSLAFLSVGVEVMLSLSLGMLAVIYLSRWPDHFIRHLTIFCQSVPFFALAMLFLELFAVRFHYYAVNNSAEWRLWLPVLTVAVAQSPRSIQLIRHQLIKQMGQTYFLDGIAKGYSKLKLLKTALKQSAYPIWTRFGLSLASSVGGLAITENLFAWPGMGNYGLTAVLKQDYPVIQGYLMLVIVVVMVLSRLFEWLFYVWRKGGRKV